jgi:hypothetical protein
MLDKLPAPLRHSFIGLASTLLAFAASASSGLNLPPQYAMILGTIVTIATTALTPLTKQYGIGKVDVAEFDDFWENN